MTRRSRKTPLLVSVNRIFMAIGFIGLVSMAAYFYWDKNQHQSKPISTQQLPR